MFLRQFNRFGFNRVFMDADDGAGQGGAGEGDAGDSGDSGDGDGGGVRDKTFTQQEYEDQLRRVREKEQKKYERRLADRDKEFEDMKEQWSSLQKTLEESSHTKKKGSEEKDPTAAELLLKEKRYEKDIAELRRQITEANAHAAAAEKRREEQERDARLRDAIVKAGCHDPEAGYRYLIHDVVRRDDALDDEFPWVFRSETLGGEVGITKDHAKSLLPEYLMQPFHQTGGSGTKTGAGGKGIGSQLTKAEEELERLRVAAERSGGKQVDLLRWQKQKREVEDLKGSISKG